MEIRFTSDQKAHSIHPDTPDVIIDTGYGVVGINVLTRAIEMGHETQVILISGQQETTVVKFNGKPVV